MSPFKFAVINPLLHSELRLKIMVALDSLPSTHWRVPTSCISVRLPTLRAVM